MCGVRDHFTVDGYEMLADRKLKQKQKLFTIKDSEGTAFLRRLRQCVEGTDNWVKLLKHMF
jgi:hypothetical protein